ncbi:hypothetical protein ROZALSC1DRAFT_21949 [Rozella allomycis CSF55]|uniref:BHLH domain-containing protein n=1 Tax=Rozella allomycis (strain CSF55) TaxID=988480 RepID=A0A4P9YK48_ROZAC|nr:hypothetical protein ROZALSC1DRAFT_21949 [Rozella allomycis CSF55]
MAQEKQCLLNTLEFEKDTAFTSHFTCTDISTAQNLDFYNLNQIDNQPSLLIQEGRRKSSVTDFSGYLSQIVKHTNQWSSILPLKFGAEKDAQDISKSDSYPKVESTSNNENAPDTTINATKYHSFNHSTSINRQRKDAHLKSERERRNRLNDAFDELRDLLPSFYSNPHRATKMSILVEEFMENVLGRGDAAAIEELRKTYKSYKFQANY